MRCTFLLQNKILLPHIRIVQGGCVTHATYRHCAAAVQAVDGSLGFGVSLELYKSTACNKTVGSAESHGSLWQKIKNKYISKNKKNKNIQNTKHSGDEKKLLSAALIVGRTFTGAVRPSQHSALVYAAKGLEQPAHVLVALLLSQHADKQLPVL